jgi:hypothetical protein
MRTAHFVVDFTSRNFDMAEDMTGAFAQDKEVEMVLPCGED